MVQFDIADPSAIEKLHSEIENDFGPVEILVNNAAILPSGLFINETFDQMKRMIDVNINAVILVIKLMPKNVNIYLFFQNRIHHFR